MSSTDFRNLQAVIGCAKVKQPLVQEVYIEGLGSLQSLKKYKKQGQIIAKLLSRYAGSVQTLPGWSRVEPEFEAGSAQDREYKGEPKRFKENACEGLKDRWLRLWNEFQVE